MCGGGGRGPGSLTKRGSLLEKQANCRHEYDWIVFSSSKLTAGRLTLEQNAIFDINYIKVSLL